MSEERQPQQKNMTEAAFSAWFEMLYTRYADDVLRVSYFYLGDRGKAEDVCHDAFLSLFQHRPELKEGREKSWQYIELADKALYEDKKNKANR